MSIAYTWKIISAKAKDDGAVTQVEWMKIGTDEHGHTGAFTGASQFTPEDMPEGDTFIPFAELTEEIMSDWIKDIVVGIYEEHVNAQIQQQIDRAHNVVSEAALPWATEATSTTS